MFGFESYWRVVKSKNEAENEPLIDPEAQQATKLAVINAKIADQADKVGRAAEITPPSRGFGSTFSWIISRDMRTLPPIISANLPLVKCFGVASLIGTVFCGIGSSTDDLPCSKDTTNGMYISTAVNLAYLAGRYLNFQLTALWKRSQTSKAESAEELSQVETAIAALADEIETAYQELERLFPTLEADLNLNISKIRAFIQALPDDFSDEVDFGQIDVMLAELELIKNNNKLFLEKTNEIFLALHPENNTIMARLQNTFCNDNQELMLMSAVMDELVVAFRKALDTNHEVSKIQLANLDHIFKTQKRSPDFYGEMTQRPGQYENKKFNLYEINVKYGSSGFFLASSAYEEDVARRKCALISDNATVHVKRAGLS